MLNKFIHVGNRKEEHENILEIFLTNFPEEYFSLISAPIVYSQQSLVCVKFAAKPKASSNVPVDMSIFQYTRHY